MPSKYQMLAEHKLINLNRKIEAFELEFEFKLIFCNDYVTLNKTVPNGSTLSTISQAMNYKEMCVYLDGMMESIHVLHLGYK